MISTAAQDKVNCSPSTAKITGASVHFSNKNGGLNIF